MSKLSQKTYDYIKDRILSMDFEAGKRITEDMICGEMQVSRTPVREAMLQLGSEQLLTIYPNRYAEVTVFDKDRIRRIGAIRLSLDMLSAYSCSYNGSAKEFDSLEQIEEEYEEDLKHSDRLKAIEKECAFHLRIAEITKNPDLVRQQNSLYPLIHVILCRMSSEKEDPELDIRQHRELIKALRTQDMKAMRNLICVHLQRTHGFSDNFMRYWLS